MVANIVNTRSIHRRPRKQQQQQQRRQQTLFLIWKNLLLLIGGITIDNHHSHQYFVSATIHSSNHNHNNNQNTKRFFGVPRRDRFSGVVVQGTTNLTPKKGKGSVDTNNRKTSISTSMTSSSSSSSSVLNELKDTIQKQSEQIESLKQQLKENRSSSTTTTTTKDRHKAISHGGGGHGGHGGGGETSAEDVASYLTDPFYTVSFQRVGWLGLFLTSLSGTALIMNVFEETLEKHIELAYFVPLLAGHGGNTGGQAVGTVLSALSTGTIQLKDAPRIVLKESLAGAMSGTILSSIVAPIAYKVLGLSFHVAVVLFFTLPLLSMIAAALGSLLPFACVFVGLDPSVIAAPAMTSLVDVTGLLSYFMIANYVFNLYGLEL